MAVDTKAIFSISSTNDFKKNALALFDHHYRNNAVYAEFCHHLGTDPNKVQNLDDIPFLPIEFFKTKTIKTQASPTTTIFSSSGTTGSVVSKHHVVDIAIYEESFIKGFELFYGPIDRFCVLALLPSYLERKGSSLVYMANTLIQKSAHSKSGFYLNDLEALKTTLKALEASGQKTLLLGVSFALLDLAQTFDQALWHTVVMETGGMKGRRKELIRAELHGLLKQGFGTKAIHSEYGMTELLSQAYSLGNGRFNCPPWMKVMVRDTEDPLRYQQFGRTGGLNVIDLANVHSCPFIATQDLGKMYTDGSFEVLGRFDHADVRGCNLMVF